MRPELNTNSPQFNWLDALNSLIENPTINMLEYYYLEGAASKWPTCACGQECKRLPLEVNGRPVDKGLSRLGEEFYLDITSRRWPEARLTFLAIEKRSSKLLKKLDAKKRNKRK